MDRKAIIQAQDTILIHLSDILPSTAVLTGGTALTRFHGCKHRFSEDLDIFSYELTGEKVLKWLKHLSMKGFRTEVLDTGGEVFHCMSIIQPPGYNSVIKVDFVEDVFSGCWLPQTRRSVDTGVRFRVDSLEAILHKKLYAVYSCTLSGKTIRDKDVVDLYVLLGDVFTLDSVYEHYLNARDIVLPIDSVLEVLAYHQIRFDNIILEDESILQKVKEWQEKLRHYLRKEPGSGPSM